MSNITKHISKYTHVPDFINKTGVAVYLQFSS